MTLWESHKKYVIKGRCQTCNETACKCQWPDLFCPLLRADPG